MVNKLAKPSIAFVLDSIYPYSIGGREARTYELTKRLAKDGYNVDVYSMQWWEGPREIKKDGVTFHAISKLYPLYSNERRSIKQSFLFGLACFKLFRASYDLIDVDQMPFFPLYSVWLVSLLKRKKMIVTWHEVWGKKYWQRYLGRGRGSIAFIIECVSSKLPNNIIAVSDHTARQLSQMLGRNKGVLVIPNGIHSKDIEAARAGSNKSDIVFAGRLLAHKNVDILLRVVANLCVTYPSLKCLIIGEGPERQALQKLAKTLKIISNVEFLDFYPEVNDLYATIKATKVFVLPSDREGFGLGLLEAIACGTPVVTIKAPNNAAQFLVKKGKNGDVVSFDVNSLSEAISYWLTNKQVVISKDLDKYDWNKVVAKLKKVYIP